ncbi:MAG: hypothetical protein FJ202_01080 [Gemmatimonadetes bacterium]|nr:hypothetical protein [Gemmatimonadota bacterium]
MQRRAEATGKPKEEVLPQVVEEVSESRWKVTFSAIPEGPFYRPVRLGEQKRLTINIEHPFYEKVYDPATEPVRAALEVLLFVLAERELEVKNDAETFYRAERQRWSERLRHALDTLVPGEALEDVRDAVAAAARIDSDPVMTV